ncbi:MAG: COG1361 S-layer family protein [Methanoregula sp.]
MRQIRFISLICLVLLAGAMVGVVAGYSTPESIVAAGKVYVSDATYDPAVFFPGDKGTLTVEVTNGNENDTGIVVNHATLSSDTIKSISRPYDSSSNIGPGQKKTYTFSVTADAQDGTYYPTFSLSFRDADSLYYRTVAKIENTPIVLTIVDQPDTFTQGKKKTIYAQVANPRENSVKNIILDVSGTGITATPSKIFVGELTSGATVPVNFSVTADQPTTLHLVINYDNGDNPHSVPLDIPITFGVDKKQANPVMSNVQVKSDAGIYHITGDVNNAGLETANTVMVTSLSPAVPQDPYKTYVVGALKPDDFGSFEVTFAATNTETVPLQLTYKDADGNVYNSIQDVKVSATSAVQKSTGLPIIPIIAVIVILALFVGGWVVYLKKYKQ